MTETYSVEELAKELAGNHRQFECFAWYDRPEDSDKWAIIYTHNRDSDTLDRCNGAIIEEMLQPFAEDTDTKEASVVFERHNHWACGWIDGFRIRVFDQNGNITPAFREYVDIYNRLQDYPVLDEIKLSELETEEAEEGWNNWASCDFERSLERIFNCELDIPANRLRQLFDRIADSISEYWFADGGGMTIDVERIADNVEWNDIREYVTVDYDQENG